MAEQPGRSEDEVQRRVAIKLERQRLLTRHFPPPPRLEEIICESVLRSPPDIPGSLEQQLFHLLEANQQVWADLAARALDEGESSKATTEIMRELNARA